MSYLNACLILGLGEFNIVCMYEDEVPEYLAQSTKQKQFDIDKVK